MTARRAKTNEDNNRIKEYVIMIDIKIKEYSMIAIVQVIM
jgi:hypothetical protein